MKVLTSWSGGRFYMVVYPSRWLVVASTMVMDKVNVLVGDLVEETKFKMEASAQIKLFC